MASRVESASASGGSTTGACSVLQLHAQDNLSQNMVGWLFQPNTSYQVYYEVVAVSGTSVTVAGDVTPLYDNNLGGVAQKDYRWMLVRPPGISALISDEGALYHQPHYRTTSCLFAGYRQLALNPNWQQCDRTLDLIAGCRRFGIISRRFQFAGVHCLDAAP